MGTDHQHRVCTYTEAEDTIRKHDVIYVNDCFCRTPAKNGEVNFEYCGCPTEVCMGFQKPGEDSKYTAREISQDEALGLYEGWKEKGNMFRFLDDEDWVCFCCKCGCGWFLDEDGNRKKDTCDKAPVIEKTDAETCTLCGTCVDICAWDARSITDEKMTVIAENCYGCSACAYACPSDAIAMVARS